MKIVSLVPSLTKTICDLGLKDKIIGITNFCVDPKDLHRLAKRLGGTKDPDLKIIKEIIPSHIIVNTEENRSADIDYLQKNFSTLVTFPKSPKDVPELLISMGEFLGVSAEAQAVASRMTSELRKFPDAGQFRKRFGPRFIYMIWRDPWMAAGHDTYISKFLELLGFSNAVESEERYPVVDLKSLSRDHIDVIFLSSEPWPFRRRDADDLRRQLEKNCPQLSWIDGKALSWYGTTTLEALVAAQKPVAENEIVREI